jgi:hypothetical protein
MGSGVRGLGGSSVEGLRAAVHLLSRSEWTTLYYISDARISR